MISGSAVALPTPFRHGAIDQASLARLCDRQIDRGTTALVVCGSTGEAASLRPDEHALAIRVAVAATAGRVPVIAGCCALNTAATAELAGVAARNGADGLLCAPPPYVRPTQDGIIAHLAAIRHTADLPIFLYDVPGRAGVAIANETAARAFEQGLIVGMKDAAADLARPPRLRALCGAAFIQLSGDDATAGAYRAAGGHGCISVTANVTPALCSLLHRSWDSGNLAAFAQARDLLAPLTDLLFLESNPIPVKAALAILGLLTTEVRLPLLSATPATRKRLTQALAALSSTEEAMAARSRYALVS